MLDSYIILFGSIWEKSEIYESFYEFSKSEFNSDSLDCLSDIRKLSKLSEREIVKKFLKIYKNYIEEGSPKEVNISSKMRSNLLELFKECSTVKLNDLCTEIDQKLVQRLTEVLNGVFEIVSEEVSLDSFPRFIRTKSCKKLMKKFLHYEKIMIPKVSLHYPIQDSAFDTPIISKNDFNFMKILLKETYDWDLAYGSKNYNFYYSKDNFLPKSRTFKGSYAMKFDVVHKCSFKKVCYAFFQSKLKEKLFDKVMFDISDEYHTIYDLKKTYPDKEVDYPVVLNDVYLRPHGVINGRLTRTSETIIPDKEDNSFYYLHRSYFGDIKHDEKTDFSKPLKMKINGKEELSYFVPSYHIIQIKNMGDDIVKLSEVKSKYILI